GHETCALGDGVVDIPGVLKALKEIGYTGVVTIEHEPYDHDPTAACALSLKRAAAWWAELEGATE
ncbi:MAG: sugar phosphate isomerase/epimerase, partial [Roseiflexaceae bacterium]